MEAGQKLSESTSGLCASGRLDEQHLLTLMKDKLASEACRNQGFVLDGFPKTQEQASRLFSGEAAVDTEQTSGALMIEYRPTPRYTTGLWPSY